MNRSPKFQVSRYGEVWIIWIDFKATITMFDSDFEFPGQTGNGVSNRGDDWVKLKGSC